MFVSHYWTLSFLRERLSYYLCTVELCGSDGQTQVIYSTSVPEDDHKEQPRKSDQWKAFKSIRRIILSITDG